MPFNAEPEWPLSTVGEVADILDFRRVPLNAEQRRAKSGPYPYWGANGIVDHIDDYIFDEPLVLMAEDGGYFDEAESRPICHKLDGKVWVNNHAHIIRPRRVERDFFYYWFVHRDITPFIKGGTRSKLNQADLKQLPIAVPALDEQRRIASVLQALDQVVQTSLDALHQARQTGRALVIELLADENGVWPSVRLGEIANFINGRGFKPHEWSDSGLPIIRIQNLNGGSDFNHFNGSFDQKLLVRTGDLLFAWSGSRGTSFGPHIWSGPTGLLNYHTWRVVPFDPADMNFLYFALQRITRKIEEEAHGASALVHMQKAFIVDYEVPLPPPARRQELATMLMEVSHAQVEAAEAHEALHRLRESVGADLLSGRVRVPA